MGLKFSNHIFGIDQYLSIINHSIPNVLLGQKMSRLSLSKYKVMIPPLPGPIPTHWEDDVITQQ